MGTLCCNVTPPPPFSLEPVPSGTKRYFPPQVGKGGVLQAAEKPVWPVIPRSRRRRGISHSLENTQGEIPLPRLRIGMTACKGFSAACLTPPFRSPD